MKKILDFLKNLLIFMYVIVVIFVTICLLSYNDYKVTVLGTTSIIPITDDNLKPDYTLGDLLLVKRNKLSEVKVGDKIFFYRTKSGETSIYFAEVTNTERVTDKEYTYTVEGDYRMSSSTYIGKTSTATVIPKAGRFLSFIESKWGFLFIVVFPTLIIFLYTLYSVVLEVKEGDKEEIGTKKKEKAENTNEKESIAKEKNEENKKEEKVPETVKEVNNETVKVKQETKNVSKEEAKEDTKKEEIKIQEEIKAQIEEKHEEKKENIENASLKDESKEVKEHVIEENKQEENRELKENIKKENEEIKIEQKEETKKAESELPKMEIKQEAVQEKTESEVTPKVEKTEEQRKRELIEAKLKSMTEEEKKALLRAKLNSMTEEEKRALLEKKRKEKSGN